MFYNRMLGKYQAIINWPRKDTPASDNISLVVGSFIITWTVFKVKMVRCIPQSCNYKEFNSPTSVNDGMSPVLTCWWIGFPSQRHVEFLPKLSREFGGYLAIFPLAVVRMTSQISLRNFLWSFTVFTHLIQSNCSIRPWYGSLETW